MAKHQFYTHPVDQLCLAAANQLLLDLEVQRCKLRHDCPVAAHGVILSLNIRRVTLDRVCRMGAHHVAYTLATDAQPAVKSIKKWLREPMKPHSAEYNAGWSEATAN
jgi:hypothetical protein